MMGPEFVRDKKTRALFDEELNIGRLVARAILERDDHDFDLVAINDLADAKANALLFNYDSTHGRFPGTVTSDGDSITVNGKKIAVTKEREPGKLPHKDMGVELVLECTGFFQSKEASSPHLDAGAKRVLISAPAGGVDKNPVALHDLVVEHHDDLVLGPDEAPSTISARGRASLVNCRTSSSKQVMMLSTE